MTHNTFINCKDWSKSDLELENGSLPLPSDETQIHTPTLVQGGGGMDPFHGVCGFSNRFYLKRKVFDFLNKMRYILRVVAL